MAVGQLQAPAPFPDESPPRKSRRACNADGGVGREPRAAAAAAAAEGRGHIGGRREVSVHVEVSASCDRASHEGK